MKTRDVRELARVMSGSVHAPSSTTVTNWTREGLPCRRVRHYGRMRLEFEEGPVRAWLEEKFARRRPRDEVAEVGTTWVYRIAPSLSMRVEVGAQPESRDGTGVVWVRPVEPFEGEGMRPLFPVARCMLTPDIDGP